MRRTRARNLVLVNWNGVFYHRYALDQHVTALEGVNGAGKTTVMIAAYVALMPDKSRLKFTNVGEGSASAGEKGIWGRLGIALHPSYVVVDFALPDDTRLLAGVHITRKAMPDFELTPFIITDLDPTTRLQDVLLWHQDGQEGVPELAALIDQVAAQGGRLQPFATAKDYFAALFDRGVTPLRLATSDERGKFNELLHTSMTGGISRALTSEFRTFLLRSESTLGEALRQMRDDLRACRTTRIEVIEARRLARELSGVYEKGDEMFAAALFAVRGRAIELAQRLAEAAAVRDAARELVEALETQIQEAAEKHRQIRDRIEVDRNRDKQLRETLERTERAHELASRIEVMATAADALQAELHAAVAGQAAADERLVARQSALEESERRRDEAAEGVAHHRQGLELAERRAHAYRAVKTHLATAAAKLDHAAIAADEIEGLHADSSARMQAIDHKRSEIDRRVTDADNHRRDHAIALAALTAIDGAANQTDDLHDRARAALRHLDELGPIAASVERLEREVAEARVLADRQRDARARIARLDPAIDSAGALVAAHEAAEESRAAADDERGEARRSADEAERAGRHARQHLAELEARALRWADVTADLRRVDLDFGETLTDRDGANELRARLQRERDDIRDALVEQRRKRDALRAETQALTQLGGRASPAVLDARDRVEGVLLAEAFEDEPVNRAAVTEARLGPLADAIVVDDPRAQAALLTGRGIETDHIWLVEQGSVRHLVASNDLLLSGAAVAVEEAYGVRVSRVPSRPTLGHRAREARRRELEAAIKCLDTEIDDLDARRRRGERGLEAIGRLLADLPTFEAGDPSAEIHSTRHAIEQHDSAAARCAARLEEAETRSERARAHVTALRTFLPSATLLDPPDHATALDERREIHRAAVNARDTLRRVRRDSELLVRHIDALRHPPLTPAALAACRAEAVSLMEARNRLFHAIDALAYVITHREALDWSDAVAALDAQTALLPALTGQLNRAREEVDRARGARDEAQTALSKTIAHRAEVTGRHEAHHRELRGARADLDALGIADASDAALAELRVSLDRLRLRLVADEREERRVSEGLAVDRSRHTEALTRRDDAESKFEGVRKEAQPAEERWRVLEDAARNARLLDAAMAPRWRAEFDGKGNIKARTAARSAFNVLLERLGNAQEGQSLRDQLANRLPDEQQASGDVYLEIWQEARAWLWRRLPSQVAETDDAPEALRRLTDHLAVLEDRLDQHVRTLQSGSEGIAGGIDVAIRRARGQVGKLNRGLRGVRFGGIDGIEIRLSRDPRMEPVLAALRTGQAQGDLFRTDIPIEEAFEEIFRRYGHGRPSGGDRLLDYREYLELEIRVKRRTGEYETANPGRLSTGEAIGVGASLMMVVLTAWENDSNLLRERRSVGTLRFLFLDEANRLSHDSLDALFDLCRHLDLQLLLAAPEVARADGNTTHHLARREDESGREQVIVTARRVRAGVSADVTSVDV